MLATGGVCCRLPGLPLRPVRLARPTATKKARGEGTGVSEIGGGGAILGRARCRVQVRRGNRTRSILAGYMVQFTAATTLVAGLAKRTAPGRETAGAIEGKTSDRGPARPSAAGARRGARVLPPGQPALRNRRLADHVKPQRCRMGHRVRQPGSRSALKTRRGGLS